MNSPEQKQNRYKRLYRQSTDLISISPTIEAQMATINAIIYHKVSYIFWVGFYLIDIKRLTIGPYQGPLACQVLEYPHGVCWQCIIQMKSIIVPDVSIFPGHIACDSRSKSELAIPLQNHRNKIIGVFDIDSDRLNAFDINDQNGLEKIAGLLRY